MKKVLVRLKDCELEVLEVPEGVEVIVQNYDERDPYLHDGGGPLGTFSIETHTGPIRD